MYNQKSSSVVSPPHAKLRLTQQPGDTSKSAPNMQPVQVIDPSSPTANDVRRALEAQIAPSKKIVKSICKHYYYCLYVGKTNLNLSYHS